MSIENVRPKTLVNIKRLARQLKNAKGLPLRKALDQAARQGEFENYEHARKASSNSSGTQREAHRIFLTGYWTDRETYESGREILEIELASPLLNLCTKAEMKLVRGLAEHRVAAPDHLVRDRVGPSQSFVRDQLCTAARGLHFMEATGLRPSPDDLALSVSTRLDSKLPDKDHSTDWYDPATGQFVLIDEPYTNPIVSSERSEWASRNGWHLEATTWPGMYFPYRCALFVATPQVGPFDFRKLMDTIDALAEPISAENWQGLSTPNHDTFLSPLAHTPQDKRRAKAKGTIVPRSSRKTVPYNRDMLGQARKPNGEMTIEEHQQAGRMIRAVLQSNFKPRSINRRMDKLMMVLVDWLYADVPQRQLAKLHDPIDVYYGDMPRDDVYFIQANSTAGVINTLEKLRELLVRAYPDCEPLRRLTGRIDTSLKITRAQDPEAKAA